MNRNPVSVPTRPLHIIHTEASLGWGGQEIRILTEAAGMQKRGHVVTVLAPPEARIYQEAARFGVSAVSLPLAKKHWSAIVALRRYFGQAQKHHPIDIVNSHSSTDSWLAALALKTLPKVPVAPVLVRTRHISASVPTNWATRWLYRCATQRVVTTGEQIRHHLITTLGLDPQRVVSIPTGIDPTQYHPPMEEQAVIRQNLGLPIDKKLIGIVATLRSWKGHRFLVEAMARLRGQGQDCMLLVIGDGPQREALQAQVATLGLAEKVRLLGNQQDVAPWLQALDIFVLPSYANEGVPQALLQAMMTGLPCVTTQAGAIGEIAQPMVTASVVPMQDAQALAAAIHQLLQDPVLGQRLGTAARQLVLQNFTSEIMLNRMETLFYQAFHENQLS